MKSFKFHQNREGFQTLVAVPRGWAVVKLGRLPSEKRGEEINVR